MAVTQRQIAETAGVSQAVVSDVLNAQDRLQVRAETRERVLEVASRMGYRANFAARALRTRRSDQIAYLAGPSGAASGPWSGERILEGAIESLHAAGCRTLVEIVRDELDEIACLDELFSAGACDGALLRVRDSSRYRWNEMAALPAPVVVIGQCPSPHLSSVAHDAVGMLELSVDLLHRAERKRALLVAPPSQGDYYQIVENAWIRASAGRFDSSIIRHRRRSCGAAEIDEIVDRLPGVDALVCLSERTGFFAGCSLLRRGYSIGRDVDLIVISGGSDAWMLPEGCWLFQTDHVRIGRESVCELMRLVNGEPSKGRIRILPELRQVVWDE